MKISENHTLRTCLRGGTLILSYSGVSDVLVKHLLLYHYFGFCGSSEYRRPTVDIDTIVMYIIDLSITKESKMELGVICNLSAPTMRLLYCLHNPLIFKHGSLLPFNLPLFYISGFGKITYALSRGTRSLIRRDTFNTSLQIDNLLIYLLLRDAFGSSQNYPTNKTLLELFI